MRKLALLFFAMTTIPSFAGVGGTVKVGIMTGKCADKKTSYKFERLQDGITFWCTGTLENGENSVNQPMLSFAACRYRVCGMNNPNVAETLEE